MTLIHLVRHGHHDEVGRVLSGRSSIALNRRGRAQAEALVSKFSEMELGTVHSSPRLRALETAAPIAQAHGLAIDIAPALDEIDFGAFAGREFSELDGDPAWHRWNAERAHWRCPGGETMGEVVARAEGLLFSLTEAGRAAPVVCVTHCDVIRGIVAHALGWPMEKMFALRCDPASLTTLAVARGTVKIISLDRGAAG